MAECVQCGWCCTVAPCSFGKWSPAKKRCTYLTKKNLCSKYDEIIKHKDAEISPAFGAGCSSSLGNTVRKKKIERDELSESSKSAIDGIVNKYHKYMDTHYDEDKPEKKEKPPKVKKEPPKKPNYGTGICIHPGCFKEFEKRSGVQTHCPEHMRNNYVPISEREMYGRKLGD